jgi:hypothetical protein
VSNMIKLISAFTKDWRAGVRSRNSSMKMNLENRKRRNSCSTLDSLRTCDDRRI